MDPTLTSLWANLMQGQQGGIGGQASSPSPYPTFSNPGGFGTQNGYQSFQQPTPIIPTSGTPSLSNQPTPDIASRGFNPWSTIGEAMVRGQ